MPFRSRISAEASVCVALGTTIVVFGLGSSSVQSLVTLGSELKWWALAALTPFAIALAVRSRPRRLPAMLAYLSAGLLVILAFESAAWSVDPLLTLKRAVSLALLFGVVGAFGLAVSAAPRLAPRIVGTVVVAATLEAVGGIVLFFVDRVDAVQPAGPAEPERFRGLSENPNTVSLLMAIVGPLAVWQAVRGTTRSRQALWGLAAVLIYLVVVLSGSRGALIGLTGGLVPFAFGPIPTRARRALVLSGTVLVLAVGVGLSEIAIATAPPGTPAVSATAPLGGSTSAGAAGSSTGTPNGPGKTSSAPVAPGAYLGGRLVDEIGPGANGRHLFESSGRVEAWYGAIAIAKKRIVDGYGFGTEELAFFDRWSAFDGSRPENSFIGMFLQLGVIGLGLLLALCAGIGLAGRRAALNPAIDRSLAMACLGAVVAGLLIGCFQSYLYSVGNIGALSLWTPAFVLVGLAWARETT